MFIEDPDGVDDDGKDKITKLIQTEEMPFFWTHISTSEFFPKYAHGLIKRPSADHDFDATIEPEIVSPFYQFFEKYIKKFCLRNGIYFENIFRAIVNATHYIPDQNHTDPHIDFTKNHLVMIMYLNDSTGNTIIFDKSYDGKHVVFPGKEFPIFKEVTPSLGKILCFDGKYYHANRMPDPGDRRLVSVFNLLT